MAVDSAEMRLSLLNGFRLWRNRELVTLPLTGQRLLAFIALHDRPLTRLHVAGTLWPDTSERRSNASLRSTLWRLRRPIHDVVLTTATSIELDAAVSVDFREATAVADSILAGPGNGDVSLSSCLTEPGDLLMGWYDDWVLMERERFRHLRLRALELLCQRLTAAGRLAEAVQAGLVAVAIEPLRETARRVLIQACLAEGNYAEAVAQFRSYRRALHDALGLEPSPHINEIIGGLAGATPGASSNPN